MFRFIKKMLVRLLNSVGTVSNYTKCVSLNFQKCMIQSTLFNLNPNEYIQRLRHCPFAVNLDRYVRSCNTLTDPSNRMCVPSKIQVLNIHIFNMTTGINESKNLRKLISCKCESKFDGRKCNTSKKWNNNKCQCECKNLKNYHMYEKYYLWNFTTCNSENGKYY